MRQMIYDIGMHNGDDTATYLAKGFHVVAVDANPIMCAEGNRRFANEIAEGRLQILNCAIHETKGEGEAYFWVCDDVSEWSSFNREIASRNGSRHHQIAVRTRSFDGIIDEFGLAEYIKIDIEGADRHCLLQMRLDQVPRYLSVELSHFDGVRDLLRLRELGYSQFKIICQNFKWLDVNRWNLPLFRRNSRSFVNRMAMREPICKLLGRIDYRAFRYPPGSSGPFGETTSGRWVSFYEACRLWATVAEIDEISQTKGLGWWFDIHAKLCD